MLLLHGSDDKRVPGFQDDSFRRTLGEARQQPKLPFYGRERHCFLKKKSVEDSMETMVRFVAKLPL